MMKVAPPGQKDTCSRERWSPVELRYGRLLLRDRNSVLRAFLEREIRLKKEILSALAGREGEQIRRRRDELQKELTYAEKGMEYYAL